MCDGKMEDLGCLPHGAHLYRKRNTAGGWIYYSDECGCMSIVWDTCITSEPTMLAAILCEHHRSYLEFMTNNCAKLPQYTSDGEEKMAGTGGSFLDPVKNASLDSPFTQGSSTMSIDYTTPESGNMP